MVGACVPVTCPFDEDLAVTSTSDVTLPDLTALAEALRTTTNLIETTARRRAAPAVDPAPRKRSKSIPALGIDVADLDGLSDRDAAKQVGATTGIRWYADIVKRARRKAANPPRYATCEAGVAARLGLRCELAAVAGEPLCRTHPPRLDLRIRRCPHPAAGPRRRRACSLNRRVCPVWQRASGCPPGGHPRGTRTCRLSPMRTRAGSSMHSCLVRWRPTTGP
jgi:hypothetical protein